jgi:hypothetical protein
VFLRALIASANKSFGDSGIKFGLKKEQDDIIKTPRMALTLTSNRILTI